MQTMPIESGVPCAPPPQGTLVRHKSLRYRVLFYIAVVGLFFVVCNANFYRAYAAGNLTITVGTVNAEAEEGATVTVPVTLTNCADSFSWGFYVDFDEEKLSLDGANAITAGYYFSFEVTSDQKYFVQFYDNASWSGFPESYALNLQFTLKSSTYEGEIPVTIVNVPTWCYNTSWGYYDLSSVTVIPGAITFGGEPASDDDAISAAYALVAAANFSANQENVVDATAAKDAVEAIIGDLSLGGVTATIAEGTFAAAIAGTSDDHDGTNGSYAFTVDLSKGEGTTKTYSGTLTIIAAPYVIPPLSAPTLSADPANKDDVSVTLAAPGASSEDADAVIEYAVSADGGSSWSAWQTSPTFEGLTGSTAYQFKARYAASGAGSYTNSADSNVVTITTDAPVVRHDVMIDTLLHGSIDADPPSQESGKSVNLTITPDDGYHMKEGSLTIKRGTVKYDAIGSESPNSFSFVMPATASGYEAYNRPVYVYADFNPDVVPGRIFGDVETGGKLYSIDMSKATNLRLDDPDAVWSEVKAAGDGDPVLVEHVDSARTKENWLYIQSESGYKLKDFDAYFIDGGGEKHYVTEFRKNRILQGYFLGSFYMIFGDENGEDAYTSGEYLYNVLGGGDIYVTVAFEPENAYDFTPASAQGGTIKVGASGEHANAGTPASAVPAFSDVTFTITPDKGYHVTGVTKDGSTVSAGGADGYSINSATGVATYRLTNVTAGATVGATFARNDFDVRFDAGGKAQNPAAIHVTFGDEYVSGTADGKLPAVSAAGWTFKGWWTKADGKEVAAAYEVTDASVVDVGYAHTLYAKWEEVVALPEGETPKTSAPPVTVAQVPGAGEGSPALIGTPSGLPVSLVFEDGVAADAVWTSEDPAVAKVEIAADGTPTLVGGKEGKVTLVAADVNDPSRKVSVEVTIAKPVTKVSTPVASVTLAKGGSYTIPVAAYSTAADGSEDSEAAVTFESSNPKLVKVNPATGKVTVVGKVPAKGATVKVTATTLNGKKTTVKIKLSPTAVKLTKAAFSKKSLSLKKGKTAVLELKLTPKNATNLGQVKFTSSNKKVATVDEAGKVTAVKKGKATITAKVGGKTAKIVVTVK